MIASKFSMQTSNTVLTVLNGKYFSFDPENKKKDITHYIPELTIILQVVQINVDRVILLSCICKELCPFVHSSDSSSDGCFPFCRQCCIATPPNSCHAYIKQSYQHSEHFSSINPKSHHVALDDEPVSGDQSEYSLLNTVCGQPRPVLF